MSETLINLFKKRESFWESPDGLTEAGTAALNGLALQYSSLGNRLVTLGDIQGLLGFFRQLDTAKPLLLLSCCPGFSASPEEEAEGLVFEAGKLRACQQEFRQNGGLIVSIAESNCVGGVYLMHGLSAQRRLIIEGTVFHDTVPSRPPVSLEQVLARGLVDAILPSADPGRLLEAEIRRASGPRTLP